MVVGATPAAAVVEEDITSFVYVGEDGVAFEDLVVFGGFGVLVLVMLLFATDIDVAVVPVVGGVPTVLDGEVEEDIGSANGEGKVTVEAGNECAEVDEAEVEVEVEEEEEEEEEDGKAEREMDDISKLEVIAAVPLVSELIA